MQKNETLNEENISNISKKQISLIYNEYISFFDLYNFDETVITDKAPLNFRWIGFIKNIFPNAKIIHCNRDPKNNCFSIFKNTHKGNQIENQQMTQVKAVVINRCQTQLPIYLSISSVKVNGVVRNSAQHCI